jgi:hypothetical protein
VRFVGHRVGHRVGLGCVGLAALLGALAACSGAPGEDAAVSEGALGECTSAHVDAPAGLWLRAAPDRSAAGYEVMPAGADVTVLERSADGEWARVRFGVREGWAFADLLACGAGAPVTGGASGACAAGQERHAYVHSAGTALRSAASTSGTTLLTLPFGAKLQARGTEGAFTKVVVPSLDESGATDRVEGFVATADVRASNRCSDAGLAKKESAGARHLLGQYSLSRAASSDNAKNATLGLNRLDGASVADGAHLTYLDRVADDRRGSAACASDADCDGADVCHQRGVCGPYYFGISTQGTELWGSGVCGTATTLHRAALDASLLPSAYTNHSRFPGSYGYPGADAEVAWYSAGPPSTGQHYRFFNDSGGTVVVVAGTRLSGSQLEMTVQLWGSNADTRYSEHEIVSLGGDRLELRRKLTRVGSAERTSPRFSVEGAGNIRREGAPTVTTLADGRVATTEEWRIDSSYETSVRAPTERFLSRNHPERR